MPGPWSTTGKTAYRFGESHDVRGVTHPSGDGFVTARTSYDAPNGMAVFTVVDNGPGIPEDQIDRVFEPFHSTKGHAGTGLGLPVAKKIVEEHRGTIKVESTPEGTTMIVQLPAVHVELASEETHGPVR